MKITQEQLAEMIVMMDKDGDGTVDKSEFKTVLLLLYPKTTDEEYNKIWKDIDKNGDGDLSKEELAAYFGFNYDSLAADMEDERSRVSMSDEQILEALQMHQALRDLEEESKKKDTEKDKPRTKQGRGSRDSEGIEMIKMPTKITVGNVDPKVEFMQACECGDAAAIKEAIEKGVSVRIEDDKGEMPLHKICRAGLRDCARLVLEASRKVDEGARRVDLNMRDKKNGYSPVFNAVAFKHTELAIAMLDWGADPSLETNFGWNLLHAIVSADNKEMLKNFLSHERVMPVRSKLMGHEDSDGRTPMHIAAFKADEEIVQLMLNNGAKANTEDNAGNTPAKLADKSGRRKSRELLEAASK